jgi:hypothetical protein
MIRLVREKGIGVEAGIWNAQAAETLVRSGLADACLRILMSPPRKRATCAPTSYISRLPSVGSAVRGCCTVSEQWRRSLWRWRRSVTMTPARVSRTR